MSAPIIVQAAPHPALDALAALGSTAEQIAAQLARLGITGGRCSEGSCPIAVYLMNRLGLRDVEVSQTSIVCYLPGTDVEGFKAPKPIADFIWRFDDGQFPELAINPRRYRGGGPLMAATMTELTTKVLARFAEELEQAGGAHDVRQFEHLAARPEGRYTSGLGDRMRGLVDDARARHHITPATAGGAR